MNKRLARTLGGLFALTLVLSSHSALADIFTPAEVAEFIHSARLDLAASAATAKTESSLQSALDRAQGEPDPARREVMLSVWLREWVGPEPAVEPRSTDLHRLTTFEPIVRVIHHEHPDRSMPAFSVAAHARNRLDEQNVRRRARELHSRPDAIEKALSAPVESREFRAGLRAATRASFDARKVLADLFSTKRGDGADASTLALVEHGLLSQDALLDVIEFAPAAAAMQAVRRIDGLGAEARTAAIGAALGRPELGGLPIALAARSGTSGFIERLWPLLDDPERGADVALALARGTPDLAEQIDRRFDAAAPRARLRMLLALRLQDSSSSLSLLADLRKDRLTAPERRATEAWR